MMIIEKVVPAAYRCSVPGSARALSFETDLILVRILGSCQLVQDSPTGQTKTHQP